MDDNESILIDRAKNGNIDAFEELIISYEKTVFNIALRMFGNYHDANDMAQEAFVKVYKSIKSFKGNSKFSTWLYRIATNVCLDEIRKRKNNKLIYIDKDVEVKDNEIQPQVEDSKPKPDEIFERKERNKVILDSLKLLSEEHRVVVIMRDINGLSYEEISDILKVPVGTIKSRISRARNSLKEILNNNRELFEFRNVK